MDALRYDPDANTFSLVSNVPVPTVTNPTDVIVEVRSSGVCGTDLHIIAGRFGLLPQTTTTLGHEFAGVVHDLGKDAAKKFRLGDRVGVDPNGYCYNCEFCAKAQNQFCIGGGLRKNVGIRLDGGFARKVYALLPMEQVYHLPDDVTFDDAVLCEPLACILHGWDRLVKIGPPPPVHSTLILGAGIIGNLWNAMMHFFGCRNVFVTEPLEQRRVIAKGLGELTGCVVMSPDEAAALWPSDSKVAEIEGVEVVVDCTGNAAALGQAITWVRRGGVICVFGCTPPGEKTSFCPEEFFRKELVIFGTQILPFTYSRALQLASIMPKSYLDLKSLGVEVFALSEYKEALEKLERGSISKAIFRITE